MSLRLVGLAGVVGLLLSVAPFPVLGAPASAAPRPPATAAGIEARRQVLFAAMLADPADLDTAFEYAALSAEAGDLEGAVSTLERMLIFAPGLPRLQLELGVLYYRLGAYEQARGYFDAAVSGPDVPAEVRERVASYRTAIDKGSATSAFEGAVIAGVRAQTNANGATSATTVTLNGLPFTISSGARGQPDANLFASGSFRFTHDLESQGDKLVATLMTYGARYATQNTIDTAMVEATLGPRINGNRFGLEGASFGFYGIAGAVALGGHPYLISGGAGAKFDTQLGPQASASFTTEYRYEAYQNSTLRPAVASQNGHRLRIIGTIDYEATDRLRLFALLTGERRLAGTGYQSSTELGVTVGATLGFASPIPALAEPWLATVSAGYLQRRFDAADPLIGRTAEVDEELSVAASLLVPLEDGWAVQGSAGYRHVLSNYVLSTTSNGWLQAGTMKQF